MMARLTFNGPIITAIYLLKKRWTGIPQHIFLQHLEEMDSVANINVETPLDAFPQAFWLQGTRENLQNGDLETEYLPWSSERDRFIAAMRQCSEGYRLPSMLDEIIFKLSDVEAYEQKNPWVKHRLVDPDSAWAKRLELSRGTTIIESLEQKIAEIEESLEKANKIKRIRKRRIESLKEQLAKADEGLSGVNAERWEGSVSTALSFIVNILQNDEKKIWKKVDFEKSFADQFPGYHVTVVKLAWKALPDMFKHSPGRPKKT